MQKAFTLVYQGLVKVVEPVTVFDYSSLEQAFRTMQQGKLMGKLVLKATPESMVPVIPRDMHPLVLDPHGTYVLVGGLGGLGRGLAIYLADHGAKYIAFISRSGDSTTKAQETLKDLRAKNVHAVAYSCDVANASMLKDTILGIEEEMPIIKGVIQGAMVLRDSTFDRMDHESWVAATRPKIQGSWNLHELMPKDLEFFVMLSSVCGIIGNRGQANYAAGNAFQDALAHYRHAQGLPACSVDLGVIKELGWVEEQQQDLEFLKAIGSLALDAEQFFSVLHSALTGYSEGDHKVPTQLVTGVGTGVSNSILECLPKTKRVNRVRISATSKPGASFPSGGWNPLCSPTCVKLTCAARRKWSETQEETSKAY